MDQRDRKDSGGGLGDIAVIGMSGRFPDAPDIATYWRNLCEGVESIRRFDPAELLAFGADPELVNDPAFVPARAVLDGVDQFDERFFGMSPGEAALTDPQHRVFLEIAWEALEVAGYAADMPDRSVGVFAGSSFNTYLIGNVGSRPGVMRGFVEEFQAGGYPLLIGNDKDYLATRVAYQFNLRGPSLTVQTACSTSLVAVCQACSSLLAGQCDMALAGGVSISFPQQRGYLYQGGSIVSPDGHCRPFDAAGAGTVFGSGAGVVLLKRLRDALADGDTIHAIVKGSAVNNDGSEKVSFMAPSVEGQAEVIALAQAAAGVSPDSVGYIEAHGTATPVGDPVEVRALIEAFRAGGAAGGCCYLGAVKGNVGHLEAASGVAGLIKAILAVREGVLPPTLHFVRPNPEIDLPGSPFRIVAERTPWPETTRPRRAGVSSFGVGGTNAHVVLEGPPAVPASEEQPGWQLFPVSAKSAGSAERAASALADYLKGHPEINLSDGAHTMQVGRRAFGYRRFVCARRLPGGEIEIAPGHVAGEAGGGEAGVVFMFPGQGAQYVGMGLGLADADPVFAEELDRCDRAMAPLVGRPIREVFASAELLGRTLFAQPALLAVEVALARWWMRRGIRPSAMIGHSVGEYAAAVIGGVLGLEDAFRLVVGRSRLVEELPGGAMLAVRLSADEAMAWCGDGVDFAASNSSKLSVLAGPDEAIRGVEERLAERGIAARRLATSHAFHSAMLEPAVEPFRELVSGVTRSLPIIPYLSNVTGRWVTDSEIASPAYWAAHMRQTVRFADGLAELKKVPNRLYIEVGPGNGLTQMARHEGSGTVVATLPGEEDALAVARATGSVWAAGGSVDWRAVRSGNDGRRIPLPTYAFDRRRHWIEPAWSGRGSAELPGAPGLVEEAAGRPDGDEWGEAVAAVAGVELSGVDPQTCWLDLGLDSLALTQFALGLKRRFGVGVAFRDLLGDLGSVGALLEHLRSNAGRISGGADEANRAPEEADRLVAGPFGPYRPLQRETGSALPASEERFLESFLERYERRTAGSKRHTAKYRDRLADPRAVAGFKQLWKEIVYPIVVERSEGARLWDLDGNEYIDLAMGFGVAFFGHQPPFVMEAIREQMARGMEIGPTSPLAGEVAELFCGVTGQERVTFCNTGSEAVLGAVRVARTVTGRDLIALFEGAYHGINDEALARPLVRNGERRSVPVAPGILPGAVANVLLLEYGNPESIEILKRHAGELAAVLVEPVQSRRPELQPVEFLRALRAFTADAGAALIFDEVITGFRAHPAGAQGLFGIKADLATYGKVVGGGLPVGVIAGSARYMDAFDGGAWRYGDASFPEVGVTFFAGTFVRHPLALAAARAVLTEVVRSGPALQERLSERTAEMVGRIRGALGDAPFEVPSFRSVMMIRAARDFKEAGLFFALLREKGIHIWEGRPAFLSTAHTDAEIDRIVGAFGDAAQEMRRAGFFGATIAGSGPDAIPLTDAQREIWFAAQLGSGASAAFDESCSLRLRGKLDEAALRRAVERVVGRHDALRARFDRDGGAQRFAPLEGAYGFERIDLSQAPGAERDAALERVRQEEASRAFDLEAGPVAVFRLVKLGESDHLLAMTVHHIACDGWSYDVILRELAACYSEAAGGAAAALGEAVSFRDYAAWDRARMESDEGAACADWWLRRYRELPEPLAFPADAVRPKVRAWGGGRETVRASKALRDALGRLGAEHRATFFNVAFGAFAGLLHRFTGATDLVIGVPAAGQNAMGEEALVGHCANLLPVRIAVEGGEGFGALLARAREAVVDAFERQGFTLGVLLRRLQVERDPSRPPLVSVTFNVDPPLGSVEFSGLATDLELNPRRHYQFDLGFNLVESGDGFKVECDYNTDLFGPESVRLLLGRYVCFLETVAENGGVAVGSVDLFESGERERVLGEWGVGSAPALPDRTLADLFAEQVRKGPDRPAIIEGDRAWTYRELDARAEAIADGLGADGVGRGKRVAVEAVRSAETVARILGIAKLGAAYVPVHAGESEGRKRAIEAVCGEAAREGEREACVMFTSGSTGIPKGVIIPERAVVRLAVGADYARLGPDEIVGFASDMAFDAATFEIWGALLNGARLVVIPKETLLSPGGLGGLLAESGVSLLFLTTALFHQIVSEHPGALMGVGQLLVGGERIEERSVAAFFKAGYGGRLSNVYGPTETTTFALHYPIEAGGDRIIPIGRPIANTTVYLMDAKMAPVPVGFPGEICLGGPGLALGYANDAALTASRFVETPFGRLYRTGDLGRWRSDGAVDFIGRTDSQVKVRGHRIELGEVEAALRSCRGVVHCAVIQREGHLVGVVAPPVEREPLRAEVRSRLPEFMVPSAWVFLDAMPLTAGGKIDRRALAKVEIGAERADRSELPRGEREESVARIWKELLGIAVVARHDDFFVLGGHSLLAIQLISRLRETMGVELPVAGLFSDPTVAGIAAWFERKGNGNGAGHLISIRPGRGGMRPFFLVPGGWGSDVEFLVYRRIAGMIDGGRPVYGLRARDEHRAEKMPESVEEMARVFVGELRAVQPGGPYLLGGECVGGVVAYEMARQLEAAGEKVALLALLDSAVPRFAEYLRFTWIKWWERVLGLWEVQVVGPVAGHMRKLAARPAAEWPRYIWERFGRGRRRGTNGKGAVAPGGFVSGAGAQLAAQTILENYPRTIMRYRVKPYSGKLTLFVDEASHRDFGALDWERVALGALEVRVLKGDHLSYIRENGAGVGSALAEAIREAEKGLNR